MTSEDAAPAQPSTGQTPTAASPTASGRVRDGAPRPSPDLPPPAEAATPVPVVDPDDESGRQAAATVRSVSRLEEAN